MDLAQAVSGYVVLTEEENLMRAHWVAGGVEAAGIPVHVVENNLADEFAMSQKLMGLQRVRVLVPRERFLEAQTVFLAMSQPIPLLDDEEDGEDERLWKRDIAARQRRITRLGWLGLLILVGVPTLTLIVLEILGAL